MITITLRMLVDADTEAIARQAQGWLRMAAALDDACEELIRGSSELEHVWTASPAAEASNAYPPCRRIGDALRLHTDTLRGLQGRAQALVAARAGPGARNWPR